MPKNRYNPRAYLTKIRNVKAGLSSRTKILSSMEQGARTITEISQRAGISYGCAGHHVRLLMKERIVSRSGKKRNYSWTLTQFGQQRLVT